MCEDEGIRGGDGTTEGTRCAIGGKEDMLVVPVVRGGGGSG